MEPTLPSSGVADRIPIQQLDAAHRLNGTG
jgi:hypothetical protein